jgi:hypothetical protein
MNNKSLSQFLWVVNIGDGKSVNRCKSEIRMWRERVGRSGFPLISAEDLPPKL